ncbi:MAG: hypothetical protein KKD18_02150 [Nanoarchaeota archaeon]|nr:hypothetical protein [Nanoarchaeota archaeon]MBU0977193.1 hypothetical protein [Nanoarchaeota archaeon]
MEEKLLISIERSNRRGLSPVVATIGLILITVAAVGLIAGIVVPLVRDRLTESTECLGLEEYFTFYEEFDYNCYQIIDDYARNYTLSAVSIEADTVAEDKLQTIKGFRIQFLGAGEEAGLEIINGPAADPDGLRMLKYSEPLISVPEKGGVKTYVYNSTARFSRVEIYPVLKNGRICKQTDEIQLYFCEPGVPMVV